MRTPTVSRFALLMAVMLSGASFAQDRRYIGAEIGMSVASDLESTRTNIGVSTNCDQWLAPYDVDGDGMSDLPLPASECAPRALPARPTGFDLDTGWLTGVHVGREFGSWRVEVEYFHRRQEGETVPLIVPGDPKQVEFTRRDETIGDLRLDNLFVNVSYEWAGASESKWTPYLGAGLGWTRARIDYSATSIRNSDAQVLLGLDPPRNPAAAGTTSRAEETLSDRLLGYQLLAGVDYAVSAKRSLYLKLRYGDVADDFEDGGHPWRPLRGHESTVGPGGAPVRYGIEAGGLGFWGVSVGVKFIVD